MPTSTASASPSWAYLAPHMPPQVTELTMVQASRFITLPTRPLLRLTDLGGQSRWAAAERFQSGHDWHLLYPATFERMMDFLNAQIDPRSRPDRVVQEQQQQQQEQQQQQQALIEAIQADAGRILGNLDFAPVGRHHPPEEMSDGRQTQLHEPATAPASSHHAPEHLFTRHPRAPHPPNHFEMAEMAGSIPAATRDIAAGNPFVSNEGVDLTPIVAFNRATAFPRPTDLPIGEARLRGQPLHTGAARVRRREG